MTQNQPFHIHVDHDGIDTDKYVLTQNGVVVEEKPVAPVVDFLFPSGLPAGSYVFVVAAVGASAKTDSDPLPLDVTATAPAKPKISVVITVTA